MSATSARRLYALLAILFLLMAVLSAGIAWRYQENSFHAGTVVGTFAFMVLTYTRFEDKIWEGLRFIGVFLLFVGAIAILPTKRD